MNESTIIYEANKKNPERNNKKGKKNGTSLR